VGHGKLLLLHLSTLLFLPGMAALVQRVFDAATTPPIRIKSLHAWNPQQQELFLGDRPTTPFYNRCRAAPSVCKLLQAFARSNIQDAWNKGVDRSIVLVSKTGKDGRFRKPCRVIESHESISTDFDSMLIRCGAFSMHIGPLSCAQSS
jgi:hypothetical protein